MSDFEDVYKLYFRDVFLYMCGLCRDEGVAEEIVQDTFVKALENLDRYDGRKDIRAWLFTIARNTYYNYCRHKNISIDDIPETPDDVVFVEHAENEEQAMQIHMALHSLREPYKEVFNLRVFGELSFEKIGTIFGRSAGWARVTYFRAKKLLMEKLNADAIDNERKCEEHEK